MQQNHKCDDFFTDLFNIDDVLKFALRECLQFTEIHYCPLLACKCWTIKLLGIFNGIIYCIIFMYVNFIFFTFIVSSMFRNLSKVET